MSLIQGLQCPVTRPSLPASGNDLRRMPRKENNGDHVTILLLCFSEDTIHRMSTKDDARVDDSEEARR